MLKGKKILITAGPTFEPIDPVRYIGNRSSGKMGIAIADELALRNAEVFLVCGPVQIKPLHASISIFPVETAQQMYVQCIELFDHMDAAILTAAVADFTPEKVAEKKIKKGSDVNNELIIRLVPTHDILAELGQKKSNKQVLVGFSLETHNELNFAKQKLQKKNLDFIVMNSLNDEGAGFSTDTNKITIINRQGKLTSYPLKSKKLVAEDIVNYLEENYFKS